MTLAQRSARSRWLPECIVRASPTFAIGAAAAATLLIASYLLGATCVLVRLPPPFAVDQSDLTVSSVNPGSYVWQLGIRTGMPATRWPSNAPDTGYDIDRGDGSTVGISERFDIAGTDTLGAAALLLVFALVAIRLGLPGVSVALGLSAAAAVGPISPAVGYPAALPLTLLPPFTAAAALAVGVTDRPRSRTLFCALVAALIVFVVSAIAMLSPEMNWPWDLVWKLPAISVLIIGLIGLAPHVWRLIRADPNADDPGHTFVDALFPLARSSRLSASAAERQRLASELHNVVLPTLGQAILEVDAQDPAGRDRLNDVIVELRRSLGERQTAVLARAGVLAAVRSYAASLRAPMEVIVTGSEDGRCRTDVEFAAYRVAQLALANAVEHSGADTIEIDIVESRRELSVSVVDDGVGIDDDAQRAALEKGHIGLVEIRNTAASVGARVDVTGRPDGGTTVTFRYRR